MDSQFVRPYKLITALKENHDSGFDAGEAALLVRFVPVGPIDITVQYIRGCWQCDADAEQGLTDREITPDHKVMLAIQIKAVYLKGEITVTSAMAYELVRKY